MKILDLVFFIFSAIYITYLLVKIYENMFLYKHTYNKKDLLYMFIGSLLFYINSTYNLIEYKTLTSLVIEILLFKLTFKQSIKETIINTIIIICYSGLIELLFSLLLVVNTSFIKNGIPLLFKDIFSIFIYMICYYLSKNSRLTKIINKIKNLSKQIVSFRLLLFLLVIIVNILLFFRSNDFNSIKNILFMIVIGFYIVFTLVQLVSENYSLIKVRAKNIELTNTYKAYSKAICEFKEFKHNLKNDILSVISVLPKEKQETLISLINKYNLKYDWLGTINDIPEGLQGLIYLKKIEADIKKVKLIIDCGSNININEKDFLDISDIIGIYLDNAIDASKNTRHKIVYISIYSTNNNIMVRIINHFNNYIDLNCIGDKNYSSKKVKSGLGLNYIKSIKNKNIKSEISIKNDLFISKINYKRKK